MLADVTEKIKKAQNVAIFNHENPDGDAMGSAYALKLVIKALGKNAEVFMREGDQRAKEYLLLKGTEQSNLKIEDCDLKIAVDCADIDRMGSLKEQFTGNTAAIDHHETHVEFAGATLVVPDAPAAGEVIYDVANELGVEITEDIAHNIYVAITCDTGSFKYSSTTAKTHIVAAKLMETGIDVGAISKHIFDTKSFAYLKAYKNGIDKLELFADGKISVLALTAEDFADMGVDEMLIDGIVNLPGNVEGAQVGVYIRQREEDFKVSLRSNGDLNVADVAVVFGGGGHAKASGFSLKMSLEDAKKTVVEELKKRL